MDLTAQQLSAIVYPTCPQCGYKMQLLVATTAHKQFVCYRHSETYYINTHTGIQLDSAGNIAVKEGRDVVSR